MKKVKTFSIVNNKTFSIVNNFTKIVFKAFNEDVYIKCFENYFGKVI